MMAVLLNVKVKKRQKRERERWIKFNVLSMKRRRRSGGRVLSIHHERVRGRNGGKYRERKGLKAF